MKFLVGDKLIHFFRPAVYSNTELYVSDVLIGPKCQNSCPILADKWPHVHEFTVGDEDDFAVGSDGVQKPIESRPWRKGTLAITLTCYQLYDEANLVFWASNTFSFRKANLLSEFVSKLNWTQRREVRNLHLMLLSVDKRSHFEGWCYPQKITHNDGRAVLQPKLSEQMPGLETLQICIQCVLRDKYRMANSPVPASEVENAWSHFRHNFPLELLRCVRWEQVSVSMSNKLATFGVLLEKGTTFPDDRAARYAEELQAVLLRKNKPVHKKAKTEGDKNNGNFSPQNSATL